MGRGRPGSVATKLSDSKDLDDGRSYVLLHAARELLCARRCHVPAESDVRTDGVSWRIGAQLQPGRPNRPLLSMSGRRYYSQVMTDSPPMASEDPEDDAEAVLDTGIRGQRLLINGWFASHADSGAPGPHVRLHASGDMDAVLKTSQIPDLVDALHTVGGRIDRMWEKDGANWFTGDEPDDNDPAIQRQRRIKDLELHSLIADHWAEIATVLVDADNTTEAIERIGSLLGVDPVAVLVRLSRFSLFTLTRGAREARAGTLEKLRESP